MVKMCDTRASQAASTSVTGATSNGSTVVDVCKAGSLVGLPSDLAPPAVTVVKFQLSVVPTPDFDRAAFIEILAAELGCPPQQIYIDFAAAGLSAIFLRTGTERTFPRHPSSATLRSSVTLQAEFRWSQYGENAVPPSALVSLLESKLADPNSPLKSQLGITGMMRLAPPPPPPPPDTSTALSQGAVAGIVIAVLVVVFAAIAWFFRAPLQTWYNARSKAKPAPSTAGAKSPTSSSAHLNDVSIVSSAGDISFHQSPGHVPFISPRTAAFLQDSQTPASPSIDTTSSPPRRPLPSPPVEQFQDMNRYSVVHSGAQPAELVRNFDVSLQVRCIPCAL
jgi:hypothetical protein